MEVVQDPIHALQKALEQSDHGYLNSKLTEKLDQLQQRRQNSHSPLRAQDLDEQLNSSSSTCFVPALANGVPQLPEAKFGRQPDFKNKLAEKLKGLHVKEHNEQQPEQFQSNGDS